MTSQNNTTPALTSSDNPLMRQIDYEGQSYYTSQYFHQQYLANSPGKGKHREHRNFLQMIRSIENYAEHAALGHVVEVPWDRIKAGPAELFSKFKPLFQATGYFPLVLINATFQLELAHHLDDELSKQMAVAANTSAARQQNAGTATFPEEIAVRKLTAWKQLGALLGTPEHIVQQEAAKQIEASTGVNLRPLLIAAPAQENLKPEEVMLEPTDLAERLNLPSGRVVNMLLEQVGWQQKVNGAWEPTSAGQPYCTVHAWQSAHGTKSGYNLKYKLEAVRHAFRQAGLI